MVKFFLSILACTACLVVQGEHRHAWGQNLPTAAAAQNAGESNQSAADDVESPALPGLDIKFLEGPDGKPVYIPDQVKLKEFLDWLERQRAKETATPTASISSISLEGTANEERVHLTARVRVQVTQAGEWVLIPLFMAEGTLREQPSYQGDGEAVAVPYDPEKGYSWWFKGKGRHELTLALSVPQRKQFPSRRVQLTLPAASASSLKLQVPVPRLSAKGGERTVLSVRSDGKESTITGFGLGSRLDVTWQPLTPAASADARLEAFTSVAATIGEGETVTLDVTQRVQSLGTQRTFDQLNVNLPPGYEVVRLDGPEDLEPIGTPDASHRLTLKFRNATTGPVELKWRLRSRIPSLDEPIVLEGFDIERARLHVGYVAIRVEGNFRLTGQPEEDQFLQRVGIADLPAALRQTELIAAYRFVDRLKISLKLGKAEPVVGTDATLFLQFTSERTALAGIYSFNVLRGHLTEVRFEWPEMRTQGWQIESVDSPTAVELHHDIDPETGTVIARFQEPLSGTFDIRLIARRTLAELTEESAIAFPRLKQALAAPAALHVFEAENLGVALRGAGATVLRGAADAGGLRVVPPREFQKVTTRVRRKTYRVDGSPVELTARLDVHPLEIRTTAEVELTPARDTINVRERVQYDVNYERLSEVVLQAGEELRGVRIRVFGPTGVEIAGALASEEQSGVRRFRVPLDQPRLGRFDIEVAYAIEIVRQGGSEGSKTMTMPLVLPENGTFSSVNVTGRNNSDWQLEPQGESWIRPSTGESATVWQMHGALTSVPLVLARPARAAQRGSIPAKLLYRVGLGMDGQEVGFAAVRIAGNPAELTLKLPSNCEGLIAHWDANRVAAQLMGNVATSESDASAGLQTYRLSIPERAASGPHLLTVEYQIPGNDDFSTATRTRIVIPQLSDNVRVEQMLCEVSLPESMHLFSLPAGFTPEFDWAWTGWMCRRETLWSPEKLESWISERPLLEQEQREFSANRYVFSRFGEPRDIVFVSMSRAGIVLVGAGVALVLGLWLVRLPLRRHALAILSVAFVVALTGVWFTEPILVLVQPAVLGVLLACGAAGIDKALQRRRGSPVLTLTTPSGFTTAASSVRTSPPPGVGSHEHTSIRPGVPEAVEALPLSESGIRA